MTALADPPDSPDSPAQRVIDAFGGAMEVHRATGIRYQEVYRWGYPKAKRGTGGLIPPRHQRTILEAAGRLGIKLPAEALVDTP